MPRISTGNVCYFIQPGLASMRPRRKCLGYYVYVARYEVSDEASMRPRRKCLGYGKLPFDRYKGRLASMRPRRKCLG